MAASQLQQHRSSSQLLSAREVGGTAFLTRSYGFFFYPSIYFLLILHGVIGSPEPLPVDTLVGVQTHGRTQSHTHAHCGQFRDADHPTMQVCELMEET